MSSYLLNVPFSIPSPSTDTTTEITEFIRISFPVVYPLLSPSKILLAIKTRFQDNDIEAFIPYLKFLTLLWLWYKIQILKYS